MFHPDLPTLMDDDHRIESLGDNRFVLRRGDDEIADLEIRNMIVTGTARMPVVAAEGTEMSAPPPASTAIGPFRLELGIAFRVDGKEFVLLPPLTLEGMAEAFLAIAGLWFGCALLLAAAAVFVFFSWSYLQDGMQPEASEQIVHLVKTWSKA